MAGSQATAEPSEAATDSPEVLSGATAEAFSTPEALAGFVRETTEPLALSGGGSQAGSGVPVEGRAVPPRGRSAGQPL